jgi:YggT family protein
MSTLISLIGLLFQIYQFLILVEVIGSLLIAMRVHLPGGIYDILKIVHRLTEPLLAPIRRLLPTLGGLDFSPMIALLLVGFVQQIVMSALWRLR